jgi:hypothetical protein
MSSLSAGGLAAATGVLSSELGRGCRPTPTVGERSSSVSVGSSVRAQWVATCGGCVE